MADAPHNPQRLFSLKMRASAHLNGQECHISGAEKILPKEQLPDVARALVSRGLNHAKGDADFLNLKIEELAPEEILYLDAPPVTTIEVDTWQEGLREVERFLREEGIAKIEGIMQRLQESYAMRGAMLLDIHTLERLEPDQARGVRATYMDCERTDSTPLSDVKNHFAEAIVLAAKVMNCPGVVGEICISDDPDYVTGYVASQKAGYRRITRMKPLGSEQGGRIFLFDTTLASPALNLLPHFKQVIWVSLLPIVPASSPIPPVTMAPARAFPPLNPLCSACSSREPHLGQQRYSSC